MAGQRPSSLIDLNDDVVAAFDFDLAVTYRVDLYEREARKQQAKMIAIYATRAISGQSLEDN
jgi:hypothetical protein